MCYKTLIYKDDEYDCELTFDNSEKIHYICGGLYELLDDGSFIQIEDWS